MKKRILYLVFSVFIVNSTAQKFDDLAKTPPMGWNSWNKFGCGVNQEVVRQVADAMVASGMKDAGYEYIIIDDCWQVARDINGEIGVDKDRFSGGIKALADYIHSKGLKFGIYSSSGSKTCAGRPGGRGHEFQDALTYARWGVDYLKYDWCYSTIPDSKALYSIMRDGLYATGRPIVFSICEWGTTKPWEWGKGVGHLWRTTRDIVDYWDAMIFIYDKNKELSKYAGPGGWNDPDMLEVGNGGMTNEEYRTHFTLWSMMAAPLIAGNDLRNMSAETAEILTNKEIIAIDQDTVGEQGFIFRDNGDYEILIKKLAKSEKAACLLNRGEEEKIVQVDFSVLLKANNKYWPTDDFKLDDYIVRDLWEHKNLKITGNIITFKLAPHTVKVFRFIKK